MGQQKWTSVYYKLVASGIGFKVIFTAKNIYYGLVSLEKCLVSNMEKILKID
jgi:hypothetical protein